jgi:hypothetical protein
LFGSRGFRNRAALCLIVSVPSFGAGHVEQRANRNAIGPLMEVIYEDFAEKLGAISF